MFIGFGAKCTVRVNRDITLSFKVWSKCKHVKLVKVLQDPIIIEVNCSHRKRLNIGFMHILWSFIARRKGWNIRLRWILRYLANLTICLLPFPRPYFALSLPVPFIHLLTYQHIRSTPCKLLGSKSMACQSSSQVILIGCENSRCVENLTASTLSPETAPSELRKSKE